MSQRKGTILGALIALVVCVAPAACGSGAPQPQSANVSGGGGTQGSSVSASPSGGAHTCASGDKVQMHDLSGAGTTEALVPCAKAGASDFSGAIKIETIPEGVHIIIHATDDQVDLGMLGSDVKTRDAVIVYPRGKGQKAVEVPLVKTNDGYVGDKIVMWDDLDKLNDEGTKFDIAVYDHDGTNGEASEEMHVSVAVSTGKSCEKALDENAQTIELRGGQAAKADLTDAQLGAPMKDSSWFSSCGLADSAKADICVAVKKGKPLGVSVAVSPENKRVAACIDRSARKLRFPESDKLDVVHQKF
jgi:hypothetical protein